MTGLTQDEAIEISEQGSSLMWSDESMGSKAYPSDDQQIAITRKSMIGIKNDVEIL